MSSLERQPYTGNEGGGNPREKQTELLDRLERSVDAIQDSGSFRRYLDLQARFHQYSSNNVLLILSQNPAATRVAGYAAWQKLGRQVRKGEKAIRILVPMPTKLENEDGEEARRLRFGVGNVFDVSQTEGEPLPAIEVPILEGDEGGELFDHLAGVAEAAGVRVQTRERFNPVSAMGFYDPAEQLIVVRETAQLQMTKTLAHELGHHFTGMHETYSEQRAEHETVAEAVAYVVCGHFGVDTGTRSFPYIATWSQDKNLLRQVVGTIQGVAHELITQVEARREPAGSDGAETSEMGMRMPPAL